MLESISEKWFQILSSFMLALSPLKPLKDYYFEKQNDFSAGLSLKICIINSSF